MNMNQVARNLAEAFETDISSRKGIGDEWNAIDDETKAEIRTEWFDLVFDLIKDLS